jgi:hypothetical protein
MMTTHDKAVAQYSLDTLMKIATDLDKNNMSRKEGTWEYLRLRAIRNEIRKRIAP